MAGKKKEPNIPPSEQPLLFGETEIEQKKITPALSDESSGYKKGNGETNYGRWRSNRKKLPPQSR